MTAATSFGRRSLTLSSCPLWMRSHCQLLKSSFLLISLPLMQPCLRHGSQIAINTARGNILCCKEEQANGQTATKANIRGNARLKPIMPCTDIRTINNSKKALVHNARAVTYRHVHVMSYPRHPASPCSKNAHGECLNGISAPVTGGKRSKKRAHELLQAVSSVERWKLNGYRWD